MAFVFPNPHGRLHVAEGRLHWEQLDISTYAMQVGIPVPVAIGRRAWDACLPLAASTENRLIDILEQLLESIRKGAQSLDRLEFAIWADLPKGGEWVLMAARYRHNQVGDPFLLIDLA